MTPAAPIIDFETTLKDHFRLSIARALTLDYAGLSRFRQTSNLFVWQNVFLSLAAGWQQLANEHCLDRGRALGLRLATGGWSEQDFREEIHQAFVINGLADFWCRTKEHWSSSETEQLFDLVRSVGQSLWHEAQSQEWGKDVRKRNAWNHTAVGFSGIATAGLLLNDDASHAWRETGLHRLRAFFRDGITHSGMMWEGLAYAGFTIRNVSISLRLAHELGSWDYRSADHNPELEKLRRVPEWFLADLFPTGQWLQSWNDSYWDPKPALRGFVEFFGPLNPAVVSTVWHRLVGDAGDRSFGADNSFRNSVIAEAVQNTHVLAPPPEPTAPAARTMFVCPEVGYAVSPEDGSGAKLSFNAGEFIGAIHDQGDNNSFTLFLKSLPIIIESGAANIPEEGSHSSTYGHNGIVADGKGQYPCGHGDGCSGTLQTISDQPAFFYARGDAAPAYNLRQYNPVARAIRHVVLRKGAHPYALIVDDFIKEAGDSDLSLLIHTPNLDEVTTDPVRGTVKGRLSFAGREADLSIRVLHPGLTSIERETLVSKGQPPFESHTRWSFSRRAHEGLFVTLVEACDETSVAWRGSCHVEIDAQQIRVSVGETDRPSTDIFSFERSATVEQIGFGFTEGGGKLGHEARTDVYTVDQMSAPLVWSVLDEVAYETRSASALARVIAAKDFPKPPERGVVMGHQGYREIGIEFFRLFLKWGALAPDDTILDIGCGGGRMAVPLLYYLDPRGSYTGFDIHKDSIDWCNAHLAPRRNNFKFEFFDLQNSSYNNSGSGSAETFEFPYPDASFTFVISTSVFTHMATNEVENYLKEVGRVLKPGGRMFATAYLMTPEAEIWMRRTPHALKLIHSFGDNAIMELADPMAAVGQPETRFRKDAAAAGLTLDRFAYGWWSGMRTSNTKQDVLVFMKARI